MRWLSLALLAVTAIFADTAPCIVVSVSAYQGLVKRLVNNTIPVHVIVPDGVGFHQFEPTPQQVRTLTQAALWFTIGDPFEDNIKTAMKKFITPLKIINLQECIPTLPSPSHGIDPHIWTDPHLMKKQIQYIYTFLNTTFPDAVSTETYQSVLADIDTLIHNVDTLLANMQGLIIIAHDAYTYLCRAYHITQLAIEEGGKESSITTLQKIYSQAKHHHVRTLFTLTTSPKQGIEHLARLLNATVVELNPFDPDYINNMLYTATMFRRALSEQYIDKQSSS